MGGNIQKRKEVRSIFALYLTVYITYNILNVVQFIFNSPAFMLCSHFL